MTTNKDSSQEQEIKELSKETITIEGKSYNKFPFLCCSQESMVLIYDYYGYWHKYNIEYSKKYKIPVCPTIINDTSRKMTKFLVEHLQPSNLKLIVYDIQDGPLVHNGTWTGKWVIWDDNNPHISADFGAVAGCKSEKGVIDYANERYATNKRLFEGDVFALLVYKKTGIPCLPDWNTNKGDGVGYQRIGESDKFQENKIPRASEVIQEKHISYGEILNKVCPNCEQWVHKSGDCLNECHKKGFC
jgi:hypothetical protein